MRGGGERGDTPRPTPPPGSSGPWSVNQVYPLRLQRLLALHTGLKHYEGRVVRRELIAVLSLTV